jgi:hypothetical protein
MEIRSYRRVFDLERRIYRIDRLRLNPGGVPVRGVIYFLATLTTALIAGRLPLLATVARVLPWYVSDLAVPAGSAAILTLIRVEGRPFHLAARALLRHWTGPHRLASGRRCAATGERWCPEEIVLLPDGSDGRMRRMRYTGPGAVLVSVRHELASSAAERTWPGCGLRGRRRALILYELPGRGVLRRGQVIALAPGARLLARPQARSKR